jgi:DNA-directed RNA polymerase specialized sigma subunit
MTTDINKDNVWAKKSVLDDMGKKSKLEDTWAAWDKDRENASSKGDLLKQLQPTIDSALTSYAPEDKTAFKTQANLIALKAAGNYRPSTGNKLSTHVFNNLKSLQRLKAKRSNVVHIPENVILEQNKVRNAEASLTSELGREPTLTELADSTGLSKKRIEYSRNFNSQQSEGQLSSDKGDSLFTKDEDPNRIWAEYVYEEMDNRDKKIFEWSTGYGGIKKLSKQEIASKLNISPASVSARISKIITKLEEGYGL